jgi:hypothetical protein
MVSELVGVAEGAEGAIPHGQIGKVVLIHVESTA